MRSPWWEYGCRKEQRMKRTTEQVKQAMEQQTKKPKDRPVKRQKGIRKGERR